MVLFHFIDVFFRWILTFLINCYKTIISPMLGTNCRFNPTCSEYAVIALKKKLPLSPLN